MLALQGAEAPKSAAVRPERSPKRALLTLVGYVLGVLLAVVYIGPALGLLALLVYLAS